MQGNIQKRKLLIISDSPVQKVGDQMLAYEPVIRELEAIAENFESIVWLGSKVNSDHFSLCASNLGNLRIISMPSVQNKVANVLFIFFSYPIFLFYVLRHLWYATHIHTRGPSHPALLGILVSFFDHKRIYWHKYAGDWIAGDSPRMYRLQKWLLKRADNMRTKVTINGTWEDTFRHIYAFENPCLSENERTNAYEMALKKNFEGSLKMLYVGNLFPAKGILHLVDAINSNGFPDRISDIYIAGNGPLYSAIQEKISKMENVTIHLLGHQSRLELSELYSVCHVLILPSASEGFPKVIAEGAAYGCIPVVTNVSSLPQYISTGDNGFLMTNNSSAEIVSTLRSLLQCTNQKQISINATELSSKFTFEYFKDRIEHEILI